VKFLTTPQPHASLIALGVQTIVPADIADQIGAQP